ncbi:MAG TPA: hypothetical protein PLH98_10175 [Ruminococcus flavefaciens]|nr:hypothetical protein [Ruminococcus flavefaciens]HQM00902.1 hypothetical protein [Ruminococcus flavefaciens]
MFKKVKPYMGEYIKVNSKTEITIIFIRESLNVDIMTNSLSDPMSDRL